MGAEVLNTIDSISNISFFVVFLCYVIFFIYNWYSGLFKQDYLAQDRIIISGILIFPTVFLIFLLPQLIVTPLIHKKFKNYINGNIKIDITNEKTEFIVPEDSIIVFQEVFNTIAYKTKPYSYPDVHFKHIILEISKDSISSSFYLFYAERKNLSNVIWLYDIKDSTKIGLIETDLFNRFFIKSVENP